MNKFDGLLSLVADRNIRSIFGYVNAGVICDYLEKRVCPFQGIPTKPNAFSMEIRNMLGWKCELGIIRSCM